MYKLVVFAFLAVASAAPGLIGAPYAPYGAHISPYGALASPYGALASPYGAIASPWGHGLYGSPVVKTALPVATSYANTVRVASPALVAPAPVIAAHAPLVSSPYAHGW